MIKKRANIVVIGAGPGGYVSAIRLGQLGKNVMLIDKDKLGGTCLNYGCIPSKALITAAKFYDKVLRDSQNMGILVDNPRIEILRLMQWKNEIVTRLTKGIGQLLKGYGHEVISGTAAFLDPNTITVHGAVNSSIQISAEHIILATGAIPVPLPFLPFDGKVVLSSKDILDLERIPKDLIVIGGGIIGLELGTAFLKMGSRLTVIELTDSLLPGIDGDLVRVVERKLKKSGAKIFTSTKARGAVKKGDNVEIEIESEEGIQKLSGDAVLVAIGVKPSINELNLAKAGVAVTENGFIKADKRLRTTVPHIFAIGDIIGPPFLAHKASKEGEVVAEVIAGLPSAMDVVAMPGAIFTDPEIATVGISETEACMLGHEIKVGKFPLAANGRALTTGEIDGMVKVIMEKDSRRIIGVHIVSPEASDLISEGALAIEMGASAEDIALTVHPHPTLSEMLMEAGKAAIGEAIHILNEPRAKSNPTACFV